MSALSNSSHDSESTPSSKDVSQYPSTLTLSTVPVEVNSTQSMSLQEPDVIASTKTSISNTKCQQTVDNTEPPIAPPRRKKKTKHSASTQSLAVGILEIYKI